MKLRIHTLQIGQSDLLAKDHLVEADDEVCVQEPSMEDAQAEATANELEVVQMLRIDARRRVDLEGVVVVRGVFEQTVEGVEHLVREKEEEFTITKLGNHLGPTLLGDIPRKTTVVQTIFTVELDHESFLEVIRRLSHDLSITILKDVVTPDLDLTVTRLCPHRRLTSEVDKLPPEVTFVLRNISIERRWQSRVVPGGRLCVMVDEVDASRGCKTHLPTRGKRTELGNGLRLKRRTLSARPHNTNDRLPSGVYPCRSTRVVVDIVWSPFRRISLLPSVR